MECIIETAIPSQSAVLAELTRPTAAYQRSARLAVAGLLAFVLLYFGLAGWFLFSAWRLVHASQHGGNGFANWCAAIVAVLLAIVMLKAIFAVRHAMSPGVVEVKREEQPRLFNYLMELADAAGAPRPHRVFLSNRVNAAVFYDLSLLNLIFPSKKNLEIGLPLVNAMPLGELRAVLAHEFGHFAQRSMAVGRWAYVAQQVVQEMVARRDKLDDLIEGIGRLDIRLRLVAWVLQIIVWSLRSLVEQAFRLVVLMQRALSREMEMQADLVAVSLTGSDALIHALHRLGAADDAWERTVGFVFGEFGAGRATVDAYAIQNHVTARMAGILDDPYYGKVPPLPALEPEQHRVFKAELGQPPRMWQTHPQNHEREENAKRRYLPAAIDQSSAWSLFDDPAGLRQRMTTHLLEGQEGKAEPVELEESLKRLAKEYRREHFQSRYCGVYFGRSLTRHAAQAAELRAARHAQPAAEASALYPVSLKDDVRQLRQLQEERAQLSAVINGHAKVQGNRVQLGGEEYRVNQLPAALQRTDERIAELEVKLRRHDATVRAWHHAAAVKLGEGWPAYLDSLLDALHYAEHGAANLRDAWGLVLNTRAVVTAVARQSENNIRRLIADCSSLYVVLDEIYRGNGAVQFDPRLMERLEMKESWQATLQKFTLPPVSRDNINDWLQAAANWTSHTSNWMGALRSAVLEQMLVSETLLASHARGGTPIAAAPQPCQVPTTYSVLLAGSERKLQMSLDWWSRFQRADGWFAGGARLAVAGGVVVSVLGMGLALGTSTVMVYNGLGTPVRVTIDGNARLVDPGQHVTLDASPDQQHTVEARLLDGRLLESFRPSDGSNQSVYNIAGGTVMATGVVHYGGPGDEQNTVLGAPRWFDTDADVLFEEPPKSVSSKSKKWRKVLVAASGMEPEPLSRLVKDDAQRKAMVLAHARWDNIKIPSTYTWLTMAHEEGAGDVLVERLKESPENVQLRRAEQDVAKESPEICVAARERAKARPDDGDRLYLALRCGQAASSEEVAAARVRFPDNAWLTYLYARNLLDHGAWNEALEPLRKVQGKLPYENADLEMQLERLRRLLDGQVKNRLLTEGSRVAAMAQAERDASDPYSVLSRGEIGKALEASKDDPRQAARMRRLAGASDGASAAQVQAALEEPMTNGIDQVTLVVGAALALRHGRDAEPYWAQASSMREYAPRLRRFIEAARAGRYQEAEMELGPMPMEARALAYAAGAVAAGDAAPARWRKTARLVLFAPERPYLRS
ncbi:Zn-dependent protease with chaperone function [Duganella sp. CF458]|uniref:M48 family metallopeptidase n=1 Tax=Duganella sp. CF458 TaxID=1884368 RepID=UPI0008F20F22|nr:M48 family metallopeptidase [Duganella sp. CF458]SFF68438.1 Zn-dependent protease with chaperone function [Duganella sp. CF458]